MTPLAPPKHILVTGATGKVGRNFIDRVLHSADDSTIHLRALCHNRLPGKHLASK